MSTGDMKNNLKKLQKEVNAIHFPEDLDYDGLTKGDPEAHLAVLYHAFFDYNSGVHQYLTKLGYGISGKRGTPFLSVVFKIIREKNSALRLDLKVAQFMSKGFAERKIMLTTAIVHYVRTKLKDSCHIKLSHQHKRPVPFPKPVIISDNVRDIIFPDVSCIQHEHGGDTVDGSQLKDAPIGAMQSTALPMNSATSKFEIHPVSPVKNSQPDTAIANKVDPNFNVAIQRHCQVSNADISYNTLKKQIESLKLRNQQFANRLDEQETITRELRKGNEELMIQISQLEKENSEFRKLKDSFHKQEKLAERVDELESIVVQLKELYSGLQPIRHGNSDAFSNSLCTQLRQLRLESVRLNSKDSDDAMLENSLSDITNGSPLNPTYQRSEKLFELVRDTRSMLGMDVNTPKVAKSDLENQSVYTGEDASS